MSIDFSTSNSNLNLNTINYTFYAQDIYTNIATSEKCIFILDRPNIRIYKLNNLGVWELAKILTPPTGEIYGDISCSHDGKYILIGSVSNNKPKQYIFENSSLDGETWTLKKTITENDDVNNGITGSSPALAISNKFAFIQLILQA